MKTQILFLHGGPGYPDYLEQFFANQFSADIKTTFFEQPRHANVIFNDFVEQINEKISPDTESVFLFGHSWGGALATEYLKETKDSRIKGIILVAGYLHKDDVSTEYQKELARLKIKSPTTKQVTLSTEEQKEAGDLVEYLEKKLDKKTFQKMYESMISEFDARDFVKKTPTPILNVFGEEAIRVPARVLRKYSSLGTHVQNLEIPGAGHFPFVRERDRAKIIAATEKFIEKNR